MRNGDVYTVEILYLEFFCDVIFSSKYFSLNPQLTVLSILSCVPLMDVSSNMHTAVVSALSQVCRGDGGMMSYFTLVYFSVMTNVFSTHNRVTCAR